MIGCPVVGIRRIAGKISTARAAYPADSELAPWRQSLVGEVFSAIPGSGILSALDLDMPMKPSQYPEQPAHLWQHFYQITQIPRPSKEEAAVRQYVIDQAETQGMLGRWMPRVISWFGLLLLRAWRAVA